MKNTQTRLMTANLKGGKSPTGMHAGGRKAGLAPAATRMTWAIRRANAQNISMIGGEEVSGVQVRRVIERHELWLPVVATPNDEFPSGATIGNVLFLKRTEWELDEQAEIDSVTRSAGTLHFVDAWVTHKPTRRQVRVVVAHFPAGKRTVPQRDRAACEADIRVAIKGERCPVVLLADFNTPGAFRGWNGARHKVDGALVRGLPASRPRVHYGFIGEISDVHAGVSTLVDLARPW